MMVALDRIRAEVQQVRASADAAGFRVVSETLTWVISLIDRERNHEPLASSDIIHDGVNPPYRSMKP